MRQWRGQGGAGLKEQGEEFAASHHPSFSVLPGCLGALAVFLSLALFGMGRGSRYGFLVVSCVLV